MEVRMNNPTFTAPFILSELRSWQFSHTCIISCTRNHWLVFYCELQCLFGKKNLYLYKQFSYFGTWYFLLKIRMGNSVWFNIAFTDCQLLIAWEANLHLQFVQNTMDKMYSYNHCYAKNAGKNAPILWDFPCVYVCTDIVTCTVVRMTKMMGSSSDDWIYWHFGYNLS
jgi:hypothetical protein